MAFDGEYVDFGANSHPVERDLFWKLADVIEKLEPERFDHNYFGYTSSATCGTAACSLGWAAIALTEETGLSYIARRCPDVLDVSESYQAHFLTLNGDELFAPMTSSWSERVASIFDVSEYVCGQIFGREEYARPYWAMEVLGLDPDEVYEIPIKDLVVAGMRHLALSRCAETVAV